MVAAEWMSEYLVRAQNGILAASPVNGIKLVGIDGPSGSGKSTFARALAPLLDAPVIEIDDFVSWGNFSGWWPRFERQVLDPLSKGQAAHYQGRDWERDEFGDSLQGWMSVPWNPIILVEGVTCTRRASVGRLAYNVWLDARKDERLRRGMERDGEDHRKLWVDWMREEELFFAADDTRSRSDLVVPGA